MMRINKIPLPCFWCIFFGIKVSLGKESLLFFVLGSSKASASFPLLMTRSTKLEARVRLNMASSSLSLVKSWSNLQGPLVETLTKVIQGLQKLLWNHFPTNPGRFSADSWPWFSSRPFLSTLITWSGHFKPAKFNPGLWYIAVSPWPPFEQLGSGDVKLRNFWANWACSESSAGEIRKDSLRNEALPVRTDNPSTEKIDSG